MKYRVCWPADDLTAGTAIVADSPEAAANEFVRRADEIMPPQRPVTHTTVLVGLGGQTWRVSVVAQHQILYSAVVTQ